MIIPKKLVSLIALAALTLTACSGVGEPSSESMKDAIQKNPQFQIGVGMLSSALGQSTADRDFNALMRELVVDKAGCAAAQSNPGYVCDFRTGRKSINGPIEYGPAAKGRFFKMGDGWQMEFLK